MFNVGDYIQIYGHPYTISDKRMSWSNNGEFTIYYEFVSRITEQAFTRSESVMISLGTHLISVVPVKKPKWNGDGIKLRFV